MVSNTLTEALITPAYPNTKSPVGCNMSGCVILSIYSCRFLIKLGSHKTYGEDRITGDLLQFRLNLADLRLPDSQSSYPPRHPDFRRDDQDLVVFHSKTPRLVMPEYQKHTKI